MFKFSVFLLVVSGLSLIEEKSGTAAYVICITTMGLNLVFLALVSIWLIRTREPESDHDDGSLDT